MVKTNRQDVRIKVTAVDISKKKQELVNHKKFHSDIPIGVREDCVERVFDKVIYPNIDPSDSTIPVKYFHSRHLLNRAFRYAEQEYKIDRGDEEKLDSNCIAEWRSKMDQVIQSIDLRRALNSLSPIERRVIEQCFFVGLTYEQVAREFRATGKGPRTGAGVREVCIRALRKMQIFLASYEENP